MLLAPAKRSQHCWVDVAPVWPPCCDILGVENRASEYALAQHCCTNLAKRLQHRATSINVPWKIWPASNLSQKHLECRNMSQHGGQTRATCCVRQCCDMLCWNKLVMQSKSTAKSECFFFLLVLVLYENVCIGTNYVSSRLCQKLRDWNR